LESLLRRQVPNNIASEFAQDVLDRLEEIMGSLEDGDGGGDGGGGSMPDMGPVEIESVPPFPGDREQYVGGAYRVRIEKAPAHVFMADAIARLADLMSEQKGWRNYMAPKVRAGQPFTITWEEAD
jgi:hypothetical protein